MMCSFQTIMTERKVFGWRTIACTDVTIGDTWYSTILVHGVRPDGEAIKDIWEVATCEHARGGSDEWFNHSRTSIKDAIKNFNAEVLTYDKTFKSLTFEQVCSLFEEMNGVKFE